MRCPTLVFCRISQIIYHETDIDSFTSVSWQQFIRNPMFSFHETYVDSFTSVSWQAGGTGDEASVEPPEVDCIPQDESPVSPDA